MNKSNLLSCAGTCVALGVLLSGCNDPGSVTAPASTGQSVSSSGTVSLSWEAPTTNTNGTPLTNLAGYRIYYGPSATNLSQSIPISTVGMQTYVVDNLHSGRWYFAIVAVSSDGTNSRLSNIVQTTIS